MYTFNQIPSEAQIKKFLRRTIFGRNIFCPACKSRKVISEKTRYWCKDCRGRFSLLSHTWLRGMKLGLTTWWLLLWCWTEGVPVKQAMRLTHLSEEAVRRWYGAFRMHIPQEHLILSGIIQLDEAYGRGWALLMGKEIRSRRLAWQVIPRGTVQRHDVLSFLKMNVRPRSRLYTDGARIYQGIEKWWPVRHKRDIHAKWEFAHTSEIEGMFGNLRTFIRRMYHHVTKDELPGYVSEFAARFSSPELFENPKYYLQKSVSLATFD